MYIWIGCKLPDDVSREIRNRCLSLAADRQTDFSGFSLPQHISLKISFNGGSRYPQILDHLDALLRRETPFPVSPQPPQCCGSILWIPFGENERLQALHRQLDAGLKDRFDIPQHPFDKEFRFHSTLCLGNAAALSAMAQELANYPLPDRLWVDTFLLGLSETGNSGSYRVVREIKV